MSSSGAIVAATPMKRRAGGADMEASPSKSLKSIDNRARNRHVEEVMQQMLANPELAKSLAEMLRDGTYVKMLHSGGVTRRVEGRVLPVSARTWRVVKQ